MDKRKAGAAKRPEPHRRSGAQSRRSLFDRVWPYALAGIAVVGIALIATNMGGRPANAPGVGDHWHAEFAIEFCGVRYPKLPAGPGEIHSHGDDVIHIHPQSGAEGRKMTLATFFENSKFRVTADEMVLPDGKVHKRGDRCPDGRPGTPRVVANGVVVGDPAKFYPQNGDVVRFVFGP